MSLVESVECLADGSVVSPIDRDVCRVGYPGRGSRLDALLGLPAARRFPEVRGELIRCDAEQPRANAVIGDLQSREVSPRTLEHDGGNVIGDRGAAAATNGERSNTVHVPAIEHGECLGVMRCTAHEFAVAGEVVEGHRYTVWLIDGVVSDDWVRPSLSTVSRTPNVVLYYGPWCTNLTVLSH